jgi:hypothetical protein
MQQIGSPIDEVGTLIRDGGGFYLRRDLGGRYLLELHRMPVNLVEKRVRLRGISSVRTSSMPKALHRSDQGRLDGCVRSDQGGGNSSDDRLQSSKSGGKLPLLVPIYSIGSPPLRRGWQSPQADACTRPVVESKAQPDGRLNIVRQIK